MLATQQENEISAVISSMNEADRTGLARKIVTICQFVPQAFLSTRIEEVSSTTLPVEDLKRFGGELTKIFAEYNKSGISPETQATLLENALLALDGLYLISNDQGIDAKSLLDHWYQITEALLQEHIVTIKTQPQVVVDALEAPLKK